VLTSTPGDEEFWMSEYVLRGYHVKLSTSNADIDNWQSCVAGMLELFEAVRDCAEDSVKEFLTRLMIARRISWLRLCK